MSVVTEEVRGTVEGGVRQVCVCRDGQTRSSEEVDAGRRGEDRRRPGDLQEGEGRKGGKGSGTGAEGGGRREGRVRHGGTRGRWSTDSTYVS